MARTRARVVLAAPLAATALCGAGQWPPVSPRAGTVIEGVALPAARRTGSLPLEAALEARHSVREFRADAISLADLAQVLWAAQGVTRPGGYRTAPSAGALYPLELSVVSGNVSGLAPGVYRYVPAEHRLQRVAAGDRRAALCAAALDQDWFRSAPAALVIAAAFERTARKYGSRAERYVPFEAGCASENAALQAAALGLGTVVVGAFDDGKVAAIAGLAADERPLAIMPLGRTRLP